MMGILSKLFGRSERSLEKRREPASRREGDLQPTGARPNIESKSMLEISYGTSTPTEKVLCANCGAKILPATAKKYKGLCAPCASGHTGSRRPVRTAVKEVKCSLCGKSLKAMGNTLGDFGVSPTDQSGGWDQWLGTACNACGKVYCPDCCNATGGPCPICGQDVKPAMAAFLPNDSHEGQNPKHVSTDAVAARILLAHTGETLASQDVNEILKYAWVGKLAPDVKITSHPLTPNAWISDEQFAIAWTMWKQMLQHKNGEHPYWDDHEIHAFRGTIARTGQRFYAEIYYLATGARPNIKSKSILQISYGTSTPTEKVPCANCGAKILPATAKKYKGLCAPCASGHTEEKATVQANRPSDTGDREEPRKVSCIQCGARILPSTTKKTGGVCMPCYHGTRKVRASTSGAFEADTSHDNALGESQQRVESTPTRSVNAEKADKGFSEDTQAGIPQLGETSIEFADGTIVALADVKEITAPEIAIGHPSSPLFKAINSVLKQGHGYVYLLYVTKAGPSTTIIPTVDRAAAVELAERIKDAKAAANRQTSDRVIVGECTQCHRKLRVRAHAVRTGMILTCKCGQQNRVRQIRDSS